MTLTTMTFQLQGRDKTYSAKDMKGCIALFVYNYEEVINDVVRVEKWATSTDDVEIFSIKFQDFHTPNGKKFYTYMLTQIGDVEIK